MTNVMQKPYSMKVKDFGNIIKTLNCFLALMPHEDQDFVFTDTDLKALLLKSMPLSWQNTYLLKGTRASINFCQILLYFVQSQSIGDSQVASKPFLSPATIHGGRGRFSHSCSVHGRLGHSTFRHFGGDQISRIPHNTNIGTCGVFLDYNGTCPVHPTPTHTWGDCFNNPKNTFTGSQNVRNQDRGGQTGCGLYYYNQQGRKSGCGYYNPSQLTSLPTLYIQQAPATNTITTDALSTVTNTDTSSNIPNQEYTITQMNTNRGEINSRELYNNVVFCDTDMRNHNFNCDTVVRKTYTFNQTLPHAVSHSHHFHSLHFTFPQGRVLLGVLPGSQITFYAFDTMHIHEVDNFQIHINVLNNQHSYMNTIQQDLLPVSLLIPKYIQSVPNHKVIMASFDSGGTISLIHKRVLLSDMVPLIGPMQNFTTLAGEFQSNRQVLLEEIVLPEFKRTSYIDSQ